MKGRAGIATVLLAALLMAAYTLLWPTNPTSSQGPTSTAPAPTSTPTTGPPGAKPSPPTADASADNPTTTPSSASSEPAATDPVEHVMVAKFATAFADAFARPTIGDEDAWLVAVAGYLDLGMQQAVNRIGPHLIPYDTVTGPATVEGERWPYRATVPTDTGTLTVTVCPDTTGEPGVTDRMTICGIDLGGHP